MSFSISNTTSSSCQKLRVEVLVVLARTGSVVRCKPDSISLRTVSAISQAWSRLPYLPDVTDVADVEISTKRMKRALKNYNDAVERQKRQEERAEQKKVKAAQREEKAKAAQRKEQATAEKATKVGSDVED